jgi:hypothetical protein
MVRIEMRKEGCREGGILWVLVSDRGDLYSFVFLFCLFGEVFPFPPSQGKLIDNVLLCWQHALNCTLRFPFYINFVRCAYRKFEIKTLFLLLLAQHMIKKMMLRIAYWKYNVFCSNILMQRCTLRQ